MPRLILSPGRIKPLRLALVALVLTVTIITLLHSRPHTPKPSIYDYTEGKYTTPWRDWKTKDNSTSSSTTAGSSAGTGSSTTQGQTEAAFLEHLIRKHSLTNDVTWSARLVKAAQPSGNRGGGRPSITDVTAKFMSNSDFANIRIQPDGGGVDNAKVKLPVDRSVLKLPVAGPGRRISPVDASALLFGVSTTYARLSHLDGALLKEWERWLTDGRGKSNGARILVVLEKTTEGEAEWVRERLGGAGVDAVVGLAAVGETYADLLGRMRDQRVAGDAEGIGGVETWKKGRYIVLVDDDVFFPSMDRLVRRLGQFDAAGEHYVGLPCERSDWVFEDGGRDSWRKVTYGGGAVVFTPSMVERVMGLPCLAGEWQRDGGRGAGGERQWDRALYECITQNTEVDLHVLPSFYNPEEEEEYSEGDRRLLNEGYASGVLPLTLHGYRNLHRFEAGKGHMVVDACGEECFLQRFKFKDNWVLVNGYSLSHYPDGVDAQQLRKEPRKLDDEVGDAQQQKVVGRRVVVVPDEKTSSPGREEKEGGGGVSVIAWAGRKRTWRLLDARVGEGGEVWQAYVKRRNGGNWFGEVNGDGPRATKDDPVHAEEEKVDRDSVVLLIWQP